MKRLIILATLLLSLIPVGAKADSFTDLMNGATWYTTEYKFRIPTFFNESREIYVDDMTSSVKKWYYGNVTMACWSNLYNWAVIEYPDRGHYLTDRVKIKSVTYASRTGVYSGFTNDGRIWYMKKNIYRGEATDNCSVLVLIYPKSRQAEMTKFLFVVQHWNY